MPPTVSIIIPTKDRAELLMQTLASVRAQTYGDWEAIVVDDNSTDDTLLRLQQAVLEEPRIRFTHVPRPRYGAQAARNIGIEQSRGAYIILLDSDDLLAPHCLEQRVPVMQADPALDSAVFPCECFTKAPGDRGVLWNVPTQENDLDRLLKLDVTWQTTSPIWRRASIVSLLPWPEEIPAGQDWEFHIRALLRKMNYLCTGTVDHYWRQAESERESIGKNSFKPQMLQARVKTNEHVYRTVEAAGELTEARRAMFAGMFFQSAERLGSRISWREGLGIWAKARALGMINDRQFKQGRIYFQWLYRFKRFRNVYRKRLEKQWPREFFVTRSSTYLSAPAPKHQEAVA